MIGAVIAPFFGSAIVVAIVSGPSKKDTTTTEATAPTTTATTATTTPTTQTTQTTQTATTPTTTTQSPTTTATTTIPAPSGPSREAQVKEVYQARKGILAGDGEVAPNITKVEISRNEVFIITDAYYKSENKPLFQGVCAVLIGAEQLNWMSHFGVAGSNEREASYWKRGDPACRSNL